MKTINVNNIDSNIDTEAALEYVMYRINERPDNNTYYVEIAQGTNGIVYTRSTDANAKSTLLLNFEDGDVILAESDGIELRGMIRWV